MILEVESMEGSALRGAARAAAPSPPPELVELEINRLTWAVVDGSASLGDRCRLADLVRSQHSLRPRLSF
jgi:hypothetical protein